jgi:hypothetical protein
VVKISDDGEGVSSSLLRSSTVSSPRAAARNTGSGLAIITRHARCPWQRDQAGFWIRPGHRVPN